MRKIRFFKKGSKKEINFLEYMLVQGYVLKNISCFSYLFEKVSNEKNYELIVELVSEENKNFNNEMKKDLEIENMYEKKLLLTHYYNCYSYVEEEDYKNLNNKNEKSLLTELNYLKEFKDNFQKLKIAVIIFGMIIWGGLVVAEEYYPIVLWKRNIPLVILLVLWIASLFLMRRVNQRIYFLQAQTGDFSDILAPTYTVIIEHPETPIEIEKLSYLGHWRLAVVTKRKKNYYFKLDSNFSEDEIRSNVASVLNLNLQQVSVVSYFGLFPIGWGL